jgi:mannosyl-oligosaccharide glucosidase
LDETNGNASLVNLKDSLIQDGYFKRIKLSEPIKNGIKQSDEYIGLRQIGVSVEDSNFIAYQVSSTDAFQFDVLFESKSLRDNYKDQLELVELKDTQFDSLLTKYKKDFDAKFETIFKLEEKRMDAATISIAKAVLSNLIGGIGFFTGRSIVQSGSDNKPVLYWQSNLLTAVPSRSFFPRGFLWDEGFHNLLILEWDLEITKDIIGHWLDLMNVEGWIPREVILSDEARAKVPSEFWIQNNQFANPPTLFLPLYKLIHRVNEHIKSTGKSINEPINNEDFDYLNKISHRLNHWYDWFNNTQIGKNKFTYRWRGRSINPEKIELNPKTLTSGLDDYPRASHPTNDERHLDLRCWMALASKVMADLSTILGDTNKAEVYSNHYAILRNNDLLNELHWSEVNSQYADYGLHSDHIKLVRQKPKDPRVNINSMPFVRKIDVDPTLQFVNSIGYVSLFPMLTQLLDADSDKLAATLEHLRDPKHLWTNYGLRSLSKKAPLYNQRNTEHDPPYWRSAIWININYLALKSLKYYSTIDGPSKERAAQIYVDLREAVMNNIVKNYKETGYIWEQYIDSNGKGKGTHPFTGWSSLVLLIMSEIY